MKNILTFSPWPFIDSQILSQNWRVTKLNFHGHLSLQNLQSHQDKERWLHCKDKMSIAHEDAFLPTDCLLNSNSFRIRLLTILAFHYRSIRNGTSSPLFFHHSLRWIVKRRATNDSSLSRRENEYSTISCLNSRCCETTKLKTYPRICAPVFRKQTWLEKCLISEKQSK